MAEVSQRRLGCAVYATASLLNHDCAPNAMVRFEGTELSLVATSAPEFGGQNRFPPPGMNELVLSIGMGVYRYRTFSHQNQTPRSDSANCVLLEPIFCIPQIMEPRSLRAACAPARRPVLPLSRLGMRGACS